MGKFHAIQKVIGNKSLKQVIEFYYLWKKVVIIPSGSGILKSRSTVGVCDEIKDQKILRLFINNSVMIESVLNRGRSRMYLSSLEGILIDIFVRIGAQSEYRFFLRRREVCNSLYYTSKRTIRDIFFELYIYILIFY